MRYILINKFSKIPLYVQLRNSIRQAIDDGTLKTKTSCPLKTNCAIPFTSAVLSCVKLMAIC